MSLSRLATFFVSGFLVSLGTALPRVCASELKAVSRFQPTHKSPAYVLLTYRGDTPDKAPLSVRGEDREEIYFIVGAERFEDGSHEYDVVARSRHPLPRRLRVDLGEQSVSFSVDWSDAPEDTALADKWKEIARRHFESMRSADRLTAFSRYALHRLNVGEDGANDFLRAQNLPFRRHEDLDLMTGAVAIEESLQLDRLRGAVRNRDLKADVPLRSVEGVTIKTHPWEKMLAGRRPDPDPIERFVPLDQYAFEASSFASFLELSDWIDEYGSPLLYWMERSAIDSGVKERLERQLCLPASTLARTLGPLVIGRVAATGGDLFLREGSDLTLIFQLKSDGLFLANLEKNRVAVRTAFPNVRNVEERHRDHAINGLVSKRREVSSYSAVVDGYALVSNSLVGLKKCLDSHDGKVPSQADGLDRRFVRTLLPRETKEDVFLFLSDPAIRRIVSPELKLRENRRLECSTSLRTIAHAAAWRHVRGEARGRSLEELIGSGDLPVEILYCPDRGEFGLVEDGRSGTSSVHGSVDFLTPNSELELDLITREEKEAYDRFRTSYQQYWSRFLIRSASRSSLATRSVSRRLSCR